MTSDKYGCANCNGDGCELCRAPLLNAAELDEPGRFVECPRCSQVTFDIDELRCSCGLEGEHHLSPRARRAVELLREQGYERRR